MVKILVVDDSEFMRGLIKDALTKAGYNEFVEGSSGKEAIEQFNAEKPDLTLLDIVMEESKGGLAALKAIKEANSAAKVIMVTVIDQPQVTEEAKQAGADGFVNKPIKEEELVETVKKVLG